MAFLMLDLALTSTVQSILALILACLLLYTLPTLLYNIFFHPLRDYPGPLLWRLSGLANDLALARGYSVSAHTRLHAVYGPIVRISPNTLSFASSGAWSDIYTHKPGAAEFPKNSSLGLITGDAVQNILGADKAHHARFRRVLSHAFSAKGLREQEGKITTIVDRFIRVLGRGANDGSEDMDMVKWMEMCSFDIMGELGWGESFGSLESGVLHPWVLATQGNVKFLVLYKAMQRWGLGFFVPFVVPRDLVASRATNARLAKEKIERRLARTDARGDFWDAVISQSTHFDLDGKGMSHGEMLTNAAVLALAGGETSSTALSGCINLLCKHPAVLATLTSEVRTAFKSSEEVDLNAVGGLGYVKAVLDETMRLYPPIASGSARIVPDGGAIVEGGLLPSGTMVGMSMLAAGLAPANFADPTSFRPERFLDPPPAEFAHDNRDAFHPFSLGTRNCIGQRLAYAQMQLILAKLVWYFDVSAAQGPAVELSKQSNWGLWEKQPVWVRLKEVHRKG